MGATFCPKCGTPVSTIGGVPGQQPYRRNEKSEKREKHEKNEKNEKGRGGSILGPLVGGLILIWLGVTFTLQQNGYLPANDWWAYFVAGIGAILIFEGLVLFAQGRTGIGPIIGGAILMLIGLNYLVSLRYNYVNQLWPLIIVLVGVLVILGGLSARRRVPRP